MLDSFRKLFGRGMEGRDGKEIKSATPHEAGSTKPAADVAPSAGRLASLGEPNAAAAVSRHVQEDDERRAGGR